MLGIFARSFATESIFVYMLYLIFILFAHCLHDFGVHFEWILGSIWVRYPPPGTLGTRSRRSEAPDRKKNRFGTDFGTILGSIRVLPGPFFEQF